MINKKYFGYLVMLLLFSNSVFAKKISIAVASNFYTTVTQLMQKFNTLYSYDDEYEFHQGSSSKLFLQIKNKAPYSVFFSAESKLIEKLNTVYQQNYAQGEIVLIGSFKKNKKNRLVIANPKVAPYGLAAKSYLEKCFNKLEHKPFELITAKNVAHSFSLYQFKSVELAIVSKSIALIHNITYTQLSKTCYSPIVQKMAILNFNQLSKKWIKNFIEFLSSIQYKKIIQQNGYQAIENNVQ